MDLYVLRMWWTVTDSADNRVYNPEECQDIVEKIEKAYDMYKISEIFLNDVKDDYGKFKIAKLRLEFARHELISLLSEAIEKGIKLEKF